MRLAYRFQVRRISNFSFEVLPESTEGREIPRVPDYRSSTATSSEPPRESTCEPTAVRFVFPARDIMPETLRMAFRRSSNVKRTGRMPTVLTQTVGCSGARHRKRCWQLEGCTPQSSEKTMKFMWNRPPRLVSPF